MQDVFGWTLQLCLMNEENNVLMKQTIFRSRNGIKRYHFTISYYYLKGSYFALSQSLDFALGV